MNVHSQGTFIPIFISDLYESKFPCHRVSNYATYFTVPCAMFVGLHTSPPTLRNTSPSACKLNPIYGLTDRVPWLESCGEGARTSTKMVRTILVPKQQHTSSISKHTIVSIHNCHILCITGSCTV